MPIQCIYGLSLHPVDNASPIFWMVDYGVSRFIVVPPPSPPCPLSPHFVIYSLEMFRFGLLFLFPSVTYVLIEPMVY